MARGDFKRRAESVSEGVLDHNIRPEFDTLLLNMEIDMRAAIVRRSELGHKWATMAVKVDNFSRISEDMLCALLNVSDAMQHDGFQTDDARGELDDGVVQVLTVFWLDGKAQYEADHRLTTIDGRVAESARITRANGYFIPGRLDSDCITTARGL